MNEEQGAPSAMVVASRPTPLVTSEYSGLTMATSPKEALRRMQELQAFIKEVMVVDTDYGTIPGTDKPTLYQPGAQKLAEIYAFAWRFEDDGSVQDWERGFFVFRKKCTLTSRRDGSFIGDGIGTCNSKEKKYGARWVYEREVPMGVNKAILPMKEFPNKSGKGTYKKFQMPNDDIFSVVNTLEKMACKRAFVMAVIGATRSAGIFTQDKEDLPPEVFGEVEPTRSWEDEAEAANAPAVAPPPQIAELEARIRAAPTRRDLVVVAGALKNANLTKEQRDYFAAVYAEVRTRLVGEEKKKQGGDLHPDVTPPASPSGATFKAQIEKMADLEGLSAWFRDSESERAQSLSDAEYAEVVAFCDAHADGIRARAEEQELVDELAQVTSIADLNFWDDASRDRVAKLAPEPRSRIVKLARAKQSELETSTRTP